MVLAERSGVESIQLEVRIAYGSNVVGHMQCRQVFYVGIQYAEDASQTAGHADGQTGKQVSLGDNVTQWRTSSATCLLGLHLTCVPNGRWAKQP